MDLMLLPKQNAMIPRRKEVKIFIVEDDQYYNRLLTKYVETLCNEKVYPQCKFEIRSFHTAHECIEQLESDISIMLLDYFLFNDEEEDILTGEDVLTEVLKYSPNCKVIMVSELKSAQTVIQLMHQGIYEYIDKNVSSKDRVGSVLQKAIVEHLHSNE
jgi:DNA-binding NtrC family response regulator